MSNRIVASVTKTQAQAFMTAYALGIAGTPNALYVLDPTSSNLSQVLFFSTISVPILLNITSAMSYSDMASLFTGTNLLVQVTSIA